MKNSTILISLFILYFMTGCFKDEGNYDFVDINAPTWGFNASTTPLYITTNAGDTAICIPNFKFDTPDSTDILNNSRFEWWFKGVLLSEERNFWMPTDTLIKMLNLPFSDLGGGNGTFSIIDKTTGVKHMVRTWITIRPKFFQGDWLILSENGADSKLSFYKIKSARGQDGITRRTYTLNDNLFEEINGIKLIGKPRRLRYSVARDISIPVGATSVITDQGAYVVNNEDFTLVSEYKNEFLDGMPPNFAVSNIFHSGLLAYIATDDGRLFRRVLTENWLGGKFLTEPYVIDAKGYKVTDFGFGMTRYLSSISPTYDELNRRVMMIKMAEPYRIIPVTPVSGTEHPTPVWEMPPGTEILYLGAASHKTVLSTTNLFTMVYNDLGGTTYMADFVVNQADGRIIQHQAAANIPFPGGNLPKGTKFLGTASPFSRMRDFFYAKGNQLRHVNRANETDDLYMSFDANITDIKYDAYNISYQRIGIGFENGDFFMIDISTPSQPRIMPETKVNVGGSIKDILELSIDGFWDYY